jgi:hypothetical protein
MANSGGLAALFLKEHAATGEGGAREGADTEAAVPEPDDHRHDGDVIMREAMDAMTKNDHQGAHDAMTALMDHHLAKRAMGR